MKKATPAKKTPVVKNGVGAKKESEEEEGDDDSGEWLPHFVQPELQQCFQLCCSFFFVH